MSIQAPQPTSGDAPPAPSRRADRSPRVAGGAWPRWALWPLAVYAASRLVALGGLAVALALRDERTLLEALTAWDGAWYLEVARVGYPPADPAAATPAVGNPAGNGAFFPLYPLAVRALARAGAAPDLAAVLLAVALGAVATVLLWRYVREIAGDAVADRAAALFAFFPGSFVLSMAYAEGLLLTCALACLLALRRRRWVTAGVWAALAGASRPNGVVLAACCAWAAGDALRRRDPSHRRRREWRALWAPALAPVGTLVFLGLLWARTGEPAAYWVIQRRAWHDEFDWGARLLHRLGRVAGLTEPPADVGAYMVPAGLAFLLAAGVLLWRWRPPAVLVVYFAGVAALAVLPPELGPRPRFVFTAFPAVIALAHTVDGRWYSVALAVSAALLPVLLVVYAAAHLAPP